jgi:hypothetical protein
MLKKIIVFSCLVSMSEGFAFKIEELDLSKLHPNFSNPNYVRVTEPVGDHFNFLYCVENKDFADQPIVMRVYAWLEPNGNVCLINCKKIENITTANGLLVGRKTITTIMPYGENGENSVLYALPLAVAKRISSDENRVKEFNQKIEDTLADHDAAIEQNQKDEDDGIRLR